MSNPGVGATGHTLYLTARQWRSVSCILLLVVVSLVGYMFAHKCSKAKVKLITACEINAFQQAWCCSLLLISKVHSLGGDYRTAALDFIDDMYDYSTGVVYFQPTVDAKQRACRTTRDGALSYFIGENANYPEDTGFALKGWTGIRYDNCETQQGVQMYDDIAVSLGHLYFTGSDGIEVMVDKMFMCRRGSDGKLRICVQRSALPHV